MNVKQLIENLSKLDPESEVMIEAPFECAKDPIMASTGNLILPVLMVQTGKFDNGKNWASIRGTDAWGLNLGTDVKIYKGDQAL